MSNLLLEPPASTMATSPRSVARGITANSIQNRYLDMLECAAQGEWYLLSCHICCENEVYIGIPYTHHFIAFSRENEWRWWLTSGVLGHPTGCHIVLPIFLLEESVWACIPCWDQRISGIFEGWGHIPKHPPQHWTWSSQQFKTRTARSLKLKAFLMNAEKESQALIPWRLWCQWPGQKVWHVLCLMGILESTFKHFRNIYGLLRGLACLKMIHRWFIQISTILSWWIFRGYVGFLEDATI